MVLWVEGSITKLPGWVYLKCNLIGHLLPLGSHQLSQEMLHPLGFCPIISPWTPHRNLQLPSIGENPSLSMGWTCRCGVLREATSSTGISLRGIINQEQLQRVKNWYPYESTCEYYSTYFIINQNGKQLTCPSVSERVNKLWYIQETGYHSTPKATSDHDMKRHA